MQITVSAFKIYAILFYRILNRSFQFPFENKDSKWTDKCYPSTKRYKLYMKTSHFTYKQCLSEILVNQKTPSFHLKLFLNDVFI